MEINKDEIWMYESVFGKDYFHSYYKDGVIFNLDSLLDNCPYEFFLSEKYLSIYQPEKYYGEKHYKLSIKEAFQLFHIYFLVLVREKNYCTINPEIAKNYIRNRKLKNILGL